MKDGSYITLGELSANRAVVFDLVDELRLAWERILNAYPEQKGHGPVGYVDGAMAVAFLHKLALNHVIDDSGMTTVEAIAFLAVMRDTFVQAIDIEITKRRARAK